MFHPTSTGPCRLYYLLNPVKQFTGYLFIVYHVDVLLFSLMIREAASNIF